MPRRYHAPRDRSTRPRADERRRVVDEALAVLAHGAAARGGRTVAGVVARSAERAVRAAATARDRHLASLAARVERLARRLARLTERS